MQDGQGIDSNKGLVIAEKRVEMCRPVVREVHANDNAVEAAEFRHSLRRRAPRSGSPLARCR